MKVEFLFRVLGKVKQRYKRSLYTLFIFSIFHEQEEGKLRYGGKEAYRKEEISVRDGAFSKAYNPLSCDLLLRSYGSN